MKILIVLLNVCMVYSIEWADPSWKTYYFLLGASSFITLFLCTKICEFRRFKKCTLIFGYSLIHFVFLCFYITMMTRGGFNHLSYVFFDAHYSFINLILFYEALMITAGLWDGLRFLNNRYYYGGLGRYINRQFHSFSAG